MGSHWRARVGQFQLKKVRSPNLFLAMCRPLPAMPWYFTVNWRRSPGAGVESSVMARRSAECWNLSAAPREETAVTVMPLPSLRLVRSSTTWVTPVCRKRRSTVASPVHFVAGIGQGDAKGVVLGIDAGLARVVVGEGGKGAQQQTRSDHRRMQLWHETPFELLYCNSTS